MEQRHWPIPLTITGIIAFSIIVLGLSERLLQQPVTLVCDAECASLSDLAAQQSMATAAWWMFAATVASLLVTIGGIFFVRASLLEARAATKIAARQVELSRHALISTDRALLLFDGCSWLSYRRPDGSVHWGISVNWRNSGPTTAIQVQVAVAHRVSTEPLPENWDFTIPMERAPIAVAPSSVMISHPEFRAEPQQIMDASNGNLFYHIWGRVIYHDVFEETPPHESTFCVALNGYGGDPTKYYDTNENPVRIYFTNENAYQHFS